MSTHRVQGSTAGQYALGMLAVASVASMVSAGTAYSKSCQDWDSRFNELTGKVEDAYWTAVTAYENYLDLAEFSCEMASNHLKSLAVSKEVTDFCADKSYPKEKIPSGWMFKEDCPPVGDDAYKSRVPITPLFCFEKTARKAQDTWVREKATLDNHKMKRPSFCKGR